MDEPLETVDDNEKVDYTYGSTVAEPTRYSVSTALDMRHVEELLRITRSKSKSDDAKAVPAFEEGQALFKEKQYRAALRKYIEAAQLGHLKSQRRLGVMYLEGLGCNQDYLSALKWLKIASERNDLHAQEKLAHIYRRGLGVEVGKKTAIYWYHRSSELGGVRSTYELATCYEQGEGVPQDGDEATRLYMIAAEQGHAGARYHVGVAYELGLGVDKNMQEAMDWYILAIQRNSNDARLRLWALVDEGIFVPESGDEAKFAEKVGLELSDPVCLFKASVRYLAEFDSPQAFDYFELNFSQYSAVAADKGWKSVLWYCYESARSSSVTRNAFSELEGLLCDLAKSDTKSHWLLTDFYKIQTESIGNFYCLMLSACLGDCYSQYKLGSLFDEEIESDRDVDKAVFWLRKAAEQGNRDAHRRLGDIYRKDKFGENYKVNSFLSYKEAANLGCPVSMFNIACCYKTGFGVGWSEEEYLKHLTVSANNNCSDAMYMLAQEFSHCDAREGWGELYGQSWRENWGDDCSRTFSLEQNEKFAMHWMNKAAKNGHIDAKFEIVRKKEFSLKLSPYDFIHIHGYDDEGYWEETENKDASWLDYITYCFHAKIDEEVLKEVVLDLVNLAKCASIRAVFNLMRLSVRKRLSTVSETTRILIEKSISESLKILRGDIKKLNELLGATEGASYVGCWAPEDGGEEAHFKLSEDLEERSKMKEWRDKVQDCIKEYRADNPTVGTVEQISRQDESRRKRIEKKQSKEQAVSDMWYD